MSKIDLKKIKAFVPEDKSWLIRMAILDAEKGYQEDTLRYLDSRTGFGDDVLALRRVVANWNGTEPDNVGQSGTLFRGVFVRNAREENGREIVTEKTLTDRIQRGAITTNPGLIYFSPEELLTVDGEDKFTTQWATMVYLLVNREKIQDSKLLATEKLNKLRLTYASTVHWDLKRKIGQMWEPRIDETILNQYVSFAQKLRGEETTYVPDQPEDYFFAVIHDFVSPEEALRRWPSVTGHETNRPEDLKRILDQIRTCVPLTTRDHRGMQAGVMKQVLEGQEISVVDKTVVNKSQPRFWEFIDYCKREFQ